MMAVSKTDEASGNPQPSSMKALHARQHKPCHGSRQSEDDCFPTPNSVSLPSHHVTPTLYHSCFVCWSALTVFPQKSEPESGNS